MIGALAMTALAVAQFGSSGDRVDPFLPEVVRPVVEKAIEAELDPKRGPVNAMAVIEAALPKYPEDSPLFLALNLRRAAIGLRRIFLARPDFEVPQRYEQALSTFSRLELSDPGFKAWLLRTLEHHPTAKAQMGRREQRRIDVAVLLRGAELDRSDVQKRFKNAFAALDFDLRFVSAKKAAFVLSVASEGTKSPRPDQRAVRVVLGIENIDIDDGKVEWRTRLFRTMTAPTPDRAIDESLQWLVRVGGRDMLFRWLATHGLVTLVDSSGLHHSEHDH